MNSTAPELSIILPVKRLDDPALQRFLASVARQTLHKSKYEILVETKGNSEQAKAYAILRAKGRILGFFCSDNVLRDPEFLSDMVHIAQYPGLTGAYTARYSHVPEDKPLSRYFALLGANDPLCWWLGKADRQDYLSPAEPGLYLFKDAIPSIGDNGFFVKRSALDKVTIDPDRHFPMDLCEDLRKAGEFCYFVTTQHTLWHRTGENVFDYLRRRYVYTRDLYFRQLSKRRWHMVSPGDWPRVLGFALASILVVPHLWVSWRGWRRTRDASFFLHPLVCLALTVLYGACWLRWGLFSRWSSPPSAGNVSLPSASGGWVSSPIPAWRSS